jgi:hypothetical protein
MAAKTIGAIMAPDILQYDHADFSAIFQFCFA